MQSSSAARVAVVAAIAAVVLSYSPIYLTPDALAQTVATLPSPALSSEAVPATGSIVTGTLSGTVVAPSSAKTPAIKAAVLVTAATNSSTTYPRLIIPSINLNDPIVSVGVDATGAMAVPNGKTNEVGWYDGGPRPGQPGSAVLDAHVFAAFTKLDELKAGEDIYIEESATQTLHFVVTKTEDFPLSQITSQDLFVPTTDRDLNLITCAGQLTPDHSTYDHRFVVYSTLVN